MTRYHKPAPPAEARKAAERYSARIADALGTPACRPAVDAYVCDLQAVAGAHVTTADAMDLLIHHILTRPVFDALFGSYPFVAHNPVSRALAGPLQALAAAGALEPADDEQPLRALYQKVQAADATDHGDRQPLICALYEEFFRVALPRTANRLGVVFTPIEVVDFMLRSTDQALRASSSRGLTDEGVQVIDPCTGTGVFLVRLLQSDLIEPGDLVRKYRSELHGHEIIPLSWYIATVNIEVAYAERTGRYLPFRGLALVDTFSPDLACCDRGTS